MSESIYAIPIKKADGKETDLSQHKGKVMLIVNVASKCGFTYQYEGLEALHEKYKDKGLVVLGFPCNQFGKQESGSNKEIQEFCKLNFGVSFPVFAKIDVNGPGAHPLYKHLKKSKRGFLGSSAIKWNFTKFLVGPDGKVVKRYSSVTKPEKLEKRVAALLKKV